MSIITANNLHEVAYQDLIKLCNTHAAKLSKAELLAIAANMLGKLIALQDQRKLTPAEAMEIVSHNIEIGNKQAVAQLMAADGRSN